jgi:hypothetical protein
MAMTMAMTMSTIQRNHCPDCGGPDCGGTGRVPR